MLETSRQGGGQRNLMDEGRLEELMNRLGQDEGQEERLGLRLMDKISDATAHTDTISDTLTTFYKQLLTVSTNIQSLQTESSRLQNGLKTRRQLAQKQADTIHHLVPPATMVQTIVDGRVDVGWVPQMVDLDTRLVNLGRKEGEGVGTDMLDMLKIKMSRLLLPLAPLYHFCQGHLPRLAHEIQVTYLAAISWHIRAHFQALIQALRLARDKAGLTMQGLGPLAADHVSSELGCRPGSGPMDLEWRTKFLAVASYEVDLTDFSLESKGRTSHEFCFKLLQRACLDHVSAEWDFQKAFFIGSDMMTQIFGETFKDLTAFTEKLYPPHLTQDTISILLSIRTMKHNLKLGQSEQPCPPVYTDYCSRVLMALWPNYQRTMGSHLEGIVKCQRRSKGDQVVLVVDRYIGLSCAVLMLYPKDEEMMVMTGLARMRKEMTKLVKESPLKLALLNRISSQTQECMIQFDSFVRDRLGLFQSELDYWASIG